MDRYAAGAIKQRCSITTVRPAERIVDTAIGFPLKYCLSAFDCDKIQTKLLDHRRFAFVRHHRPDLAQAVCKTEFGRRLAGGHCEFLCVAMASPQLTDRKS